jgi:hypothetical protein
VYLKQGISLLIPNSLPGESDERLFHRTVALFGISVYTHPDGCREVLMENNRYDANDPLRKAERHHMKKNGLRIGKTERISVATVPE